MHTWRQKPEAYDKHAYIIRNPWPVRALFAAGLFSWLGVMYGYVLFLNLNVWYWIVFGPVLAILSVYYVLNYGISLFYRSFDVKKHEALVRSSWSKRKVMPTVDIFLPVCGEGAGILEWTFAAVQAINYPNKRVHVLDDKGSDGTKRLAEKMGFAYLSRPNKGEMKKAGNLQYAFERTDGEFVVIFDADFAPHPDFVIDLLPYMDDPKVGIVQSPQDFPLNDRLHKRSMLGYGAGHVQEDFYRVVQPSRDTFGGAICVGSNAVYRRSAIEEIGGMPQVEHSEDVITGFKLLAKGRKVKFVPLVLAQGLCPEEIHAYFHQQHRWCSGSMRLCLSKEFWTAPIPLAQKLCYFTGLLYYVAHALVLVLAFQVYVVLLFHFDVITLANALPFVPHLAFTFIALPLFRRAGHRYGTSLARATQQFSCSHAVLSHLVGRGLEWHPTNSKKTRAALPFITLVAFNGAYLLAHVVLISIAIAQGKFPIFEIHYYSVMFWVLYNLGTSFIFLLHGRAALKTYAAAERPDSPTHAGLRFIGVCAAFSVLAPTLATAIVTQRPTAVPAAIAATEIAAVPAADEPLVDAHAEDARITSYVFAAEAGDSMTVLVRRAVTAYLAETGRSLDAARRVYVETNVVAAKGARPLSIGETVATAPDEMEPHIVASGGLPQDALDRWSAYAANVAFE